MKQLWYALQERLILRVQWQHKVIHWCSESLDHFCTARPYFLMHAHAHTLPALQHRGTVPQAAFLSSSRAACLEQPPASAHSSSKEQKNPPWPATVQPLADMQKQQLQCFPCVTSQVPEHFPGRAKDLHMSAYTLGDCCSGKRDFTDVHFASCKYLRFHSSVPKPT